MGNIIENAIEYAKSFFASDYSGHDFSHTYRVYTLAKRIAEHEKCEFEIVCISALLHDVDDVKLVSEDDTNYKNARKFLKENNYPDEKIEIVCHIISQVSFKWKDNIVPDTIEGKIVQDADRLDAMGAIGIARTFTFGGNRLINMHIPNMKYRENIDFDNHKNSETTINHFYEKLFKLKDLMNTEVAKEIAEQRHIYMEEFLKEFYDEWDGRR